MKSVGEAMAIGRNFARRCRRRCAALEKKGSSFTGGERPATEQAREIAR
jgi:carbamoylphosphate synthase large subunit